MNIVLKNGILYVPRTAESIVFGVIGDGSIPYTKKDAEYNKYMTLYEKQEQENKRILSLLSNI